MLIITWFEMKLKHCSKSSLRVVLTHDSIVVFGYSFVVPEQNRLASAS